jgi:uncharacterized membrane protein HdeD (DUF308 family)
MMDRHELDPVSLVFGALFSVFGAIWLFDPPDLEAWDWRWVWPIPLMAIGLALVYSAWRRGPGSSGE